MHRNPLEVFIMTEDIIEKKKEFIYRGKNLEELKKLDVREFAKLLPSRERRTILRNSDLIERFVAKCKKYTENNKNIRTHKREIIIVPDMTNSPSLCPSISGTTFTGSKTLPLWTYIVKLVISGTIIISLFCVLIFLLFSVYFLHFATNLSIKSLFLNIVLLSLEGSNLANSLTSNFFNSSRFFPLYINSFFFSIISSVIIKTSSGFLCIQQPIYFLSYYFPPPFLTPVLLALILPTFAPGGAFLLGIFPRPP